MPKLTTVPLTDLDASVDKMISAGKAVKEGIATHAQKHREAVDARRHALERERKVQEGIRRSVSQIPTANS